MLWPTTLTREEEDDLVASCHHIAAGNWPQLAALDLSRNLLTAAAMAELAKGNWPALQKLNLSFNNQDGYQWYMGKPFEAAPIVEQLALSAWTALQELDLRCMGLGHADFHWLQNTMWPQLTAIDFRGIHSFGGGGAEGTVISILLVMHGRCHNRNGLWCPCGLDIPACQAWRV